MKKILNAQEKMDELRELCETFKNDGILYEDDVDFFLGQVQCIEPEVRIRKELCYGGDSMFAMVSTTENAEVDFEASFSQSALWPDEWKMLDCILTEQGVWH